MKENKKCLCNKCKQNTNHAVLFERKQNWSNDETDITGEDTYYVVQCCGCDTISFLYESINSEDFEEQDGELISTIFTSQFPGVSINYGNISDKYSLPNDIRKVYEETISSITQGNLLLACIGLRTIIDIICKNEGINRRNLVQQIEALKEARIVSESDSKLLQGIRNLGNNATHEGINPNKETIILATNIIEHIIETKYIYKKQADRLLSTAIYKYEEYVQVMVEELNSIKMNSLCEIEDLQKRQAKRLVTSESKQYENKFIEDINKNMFNNLSITNNSGKICCQRTGYVFHKEIQKEQSGNNFVIK